MASGDELAASIRAALAGAGTIREVKMFGGIGFMLNGNMVAAASKRGLLARVGKERQAEALARPGEAPMIMRGRTIEGYIRITPAELTNASVKSWLQLASAFVRTLPAKRAKPAQAKRKRKSRAVTKSRTSR